MGLQYSQENQPPAILKKFVQKEEERIKKEKQIPKIGRSMKVEIKERVQTELIRKAIPLPTVYDLCWNMTESNLLFFTTNKKAHALLEDFFKESFGLLIMQQIPYVTAEHLLDEGDREKLARISPDIFV